MERSFSPSRYLILYLPWVLSYFSDSFFELSYMISWLGSIFIFYFSLSGRIKPLPDDLTIEQQILRPLFLIQVIFAGYMAITSIFYFLDVLGYRYFTFVGNSISALDPDLSVIASCQRDYVLGHAALVHGILLFMKYPIKIKYVANVHTWSTFLIQLTVICYPLGYIFQKLPGLDQFSNQISSLGFVAGTLALAVAIPEGKTINVAGAGLLYGIGFLNSLVSGYKEPVIVSIILLGIFLFPFYRKTVLLFFIPILFLSFTLLPTYVQLFRDAWSSGTLNSVDEVKAEALSKIKSKDMTANFADNNWAFLVGRLSEINMFTQYKKNVSKTDNYYGFQLVDQAIKSVVPRIFWPKKPITEEVVMERVYTAEVISRSSDVSAKPPPVVDGYLSGGSFGVWLLLFSYGLLAQWIALKAEGLFGGYFMGIALVYTGLFQIFWRGNSLEFLLNSILWSFVSMWIIFLIMKSIGILKKVKPESVTLLPNSV